MSACRLIAADIPLPEWRPPQEYPLEINIDEGTIYDGGADDNFFLHHFPYAEEYTNKKYGVSLEWNYTEGRARQIIDYLRAALQKTDAVELWQVWLMDYYEFEERPFIHCQTVAIQDLTPEHIKEIDQAEIWNTPDKKYPERPSFYCLTAIR